MRKALGDDVALLVDANSGFSPPRAIEVGRLLQDWGISHYEEPCPYWELEQTRQVREALDLDVTGGEQDCWIPTFRQMIAMGAVDVVQPDICYLGGLTRTLRVAELAHAAGLPCTPHSANLSLVTLFTMHLLGAIPNAGKYLELSIEGPDYYPWQDGLFVRSPYTVVDGQVTIPSEPGWGVEIDPGLAGAVAAPAERARMNDAPGLRELVQEVLRTGTLSGLPEQHYIDGRFAPSASRPFDGDVRSCSRSGVRPLRGRRRRGRRRRGARRPCGARRAWRRTTPAERGRILQRTAALLRAQADRLAVVEALDAGKTLAEARGDVAGAARTFEYYAGACDKLQGDTIPLDDGHLAYTILEPIGVCAQIVPWNYPISTTARALRRRSPPVARSSSNRPRPRR